MTQGGPGGDRSAVVTALRAVTGVADAEILPDPAGGPGTLRLQLEPDADEVLVATTVHRLLGEKFGLGVDAGRVQVVEEAVTRRANGVAAGAGAESGPRPGAAAASPGEEAADQGEATQAPDVAVWPPPSVRSASTGRVASAAEARRATPQFPRPEAGLAASPGQRPTPATLGTVADLGRTEQTGPARGVRLLIHRMQLVSATQGVTSEVTLELSGQEHTGTAGAASTATSVHRSVALATLRAVEGALGGQVRFELEHLETTSLGADRAVVVEVAMITKHGSERLAGVSAVREDARQAVIRATLDAINRRIETYLVPA